MSKVNKILTNFANSKIGNKFYNKMLDPKNEKFVNNTLPLVETLTASACAVTATALNKKIDDKSKKGLQINNALKLGFSLFIAGGITKTVNTFTDTVIKNLNPENLKQATKVADGVKVFVPIVSTILISRYLTPVIFTNASAKIRDFIEEKKNKKLDIKA